MKIFKEINRMIEKHQDACNTKDLYTGHYDFVEMDAEDKKILHRDWTPLGSTLYQKTISNVSYTFDLVFPEE